jgi:hypothetical protein
VARWVRDGGGLPRDPMDRSDTARRHPVAGPVVGFGRTST